MPWVVTMPDFSANVTSRLDGAILMTSVPCLPPAEAKAAVQPRLVTTPK
jgi:hypothetical protein